uniref:ROK family protein n=1 Tax=candidate division WOR-3 bacterium TaxID=2052148 RepID=A0A7V3NV75_UNCW3
MKLKRILSFDIGGTNVKYGVVEDGKILERGSFPTDVDKGKDFLISRLVELAKEKIDRIDGIGLAVAGLVDHEKGIVYEPPNLPGWNYVPIKEIIESKTEKPTFVLNDANAFVLGEWQFGIGRKVSNVVGITLGTVFGGGIIAHGKLLLGGVHFAAEIGHMVIDPSGPVCNCGQRGCWEAFLGSAYFSQRAKVFLQKYGIVLKEYSPKELSELAKQGSEPAKLLWEEFGYFLGIGLTNLTHIFDPEVFVIGGGVSNAFELFIESATNTMKERVMGYAKRRIEIRKSSLGDDSALLGAYYFAHEEGKVW